MDGKMRVSQVYELQRTALVNVHYYAARITKLARINRVFQIIAALAASGTIASVSQDVPPGWGKAASITGSVIAALAASFVAVFNWSDRLARLERMHSAYKMLYHSAENLAKQTIGADRLTPEQESVAGMLESQLAALGPQDEIDPDPQLMKKAQERTEQQLPDSYYYSESA